MADGFTMRDTAEQDWPSIDRTLMTADALPAPPLPLDIFPRAWLAWIARAAAAAGAPPDYVACALLAVAGATIGNARWGRPWEGWQHPPIINVACIGNPSAGKTPAINSCTSPLAHLAAEQNLDWEERLRDYRTARQAAKEARVLWEAEVKRAVKDGLPPPREPDGAREPDMPHKRRIYTSEATVEAARELSKITPRGLLLHRDELAGWIAGMDRYGNGAAGADRAFWLQAYDGGRWTVDRVRDGDDGADIAHLTWGIVGGIQPDRLASLLLSGDDDGLAARFLYTWPAPLPDVSPIPHGLGLPFLLVPILRRLRELPMTNAEPVSLSFTAEAQAHLQEWRREAAAMEAQASGLFLSWLGKLPGFAVRLAVIFAHLDWVLVADERPPPEAITADALARALGFLADYAAPMARRAFGEAALPQAEHDARRLARWLLRQHQVPETLNARELRRRSDGPAIATAERLTAALHELAELGWVRQPSRQSAPGGGRPRSDWAVNPALRGDAP